MKKYISLILCLLLPFLLASCACDRDKDQAQRQVLFDLGESVSLGDVDDLSDLDLTGEEEEYPVDEDFRVGKFYGDVVIPFRVKGDVKFLDVRLNDTMTVEMILDTGASMTLLSLSEAQYLFNKGTITESDFLGTSQSTIADGSVVENALINLRELTIGDQITLYNVRVTVSESTRAPLLLGNEVLDRMHGYTIDNATNTITFHGL